MISVKPCPYCNGDRGPSLTILEEYKPYVIVRCSECGNLIGKFYAGNSPRYEAIQLWNEVYERMSCINA